MMRILVRITIITGLLCFLLTHVIPAQSEQRHDRPSADIFNVDILDVSSQNLVGNIGEILQLHSKIGKSKGTSIFESASLKISPKDGSNFLSKKRDLALIIVSCGNNACINEIQEDIDNLGGEIFLVFSTHAIIGQISQELHGTLLQRDEIEHIFYSEIESSQVQSTDVGINSVVQFWNELKSGKLFEKDEKPEIKPIPNDMLPHPFPEEIRKPLGKGTSDFMTGSILVDVIFPESDGNVDPDLENWTTTMKQNVLNEIATACLWWINMNPIASISFTLVYVKDEYCGTSYEPISRPHTDEHLWINQIMDNLGVPWLPLHTWRVALWNEALRLSYGTDWVYTIFVANSLSDADGEFSDGWFAYAYLGGPFVVMTYKNNGYRISNMDAVAAHETGHIFWAFDEYAVSGCNCSQEHNGYLNSNCENGCPSDVACIMRGGISPFTGRAICYFTQGHIGWTPRPFPRIINVDYDDEIALGEYADIYVRVRNDGGNSEDGGISISFPSFTGSNDDQYVSLVTSSGDAPGYNEFPAGTQIWHRDGYQFPANYLLAEWADNSWDYDEENYVEIRVWPQQLGTFQLNVRSAMGLSSVYFNYPIFSSDYDQQGWEVDRYTLSVVDKTPPTPNPMTWSTEPYETSTSSISMVATTASDPSPPVYYYFDFYNSPTGGSGGSDGNWRTSTSYSDGGLQANHQYGYRVKAKDNASPPNQTGYSGVSYDYTDIETPSGITFCTIGNNFIEAKSANIPSGLTRGSSGLLIENVTNGDNSGWKRDNNCWRSSGLSVNSRYGFRARARNGDADQTPWSPTTYRYTQIESPIGIVFGTITPTSIEAKSSNTPSNLTNGSSGLIIENVTKGTNSGWKQNNNFWNSTSLSYNTQYEFKAKARNGDGDETSYCPSSLKHTHANVPAAPVVFNPTSTTLDVDVIPNGNPDWTQFAIYNITGSYYINASGGNNGVLPVWQTDSQWDTVTVIGLLPNKWYSFKVKAKNAEGVETDFGPADSGKTTQEEDTSPPLPDPMTWSAIPYGASTTSISMCATKATDDSPPVYYYFDFYSGGPGGSDGDWQTDTCYADNGLSPNTQYGYRVKARDNASPPNEGGYSSVSYAYTHIQTPSELSLSPDTTSIILCVQDSLSNLTLGCSGLFFDGATGDGFKQWIQVKCDTATGLSVNTQYSFRAKARNGDCIETPYSHWHTIYTLAREPLAPTVTDPTDTTLNVDVNPNGNPPWTLFALYNATDDYYIDSVGGNNGMTPVWQTDNEWGVVTVRGLLPDSTYCFQAKAKNGDGEETSFGPFGCGRTGKGWVVDSISLAYGWNMVSMPTIPSDSSVGSVFPGMGVWTWDCDSIHYYGPTYVTRGKGYWLLRGGSDTTITVSGEPITFFIDTLCYGWNMIGATNEAVPFSSIVQNPYGCIIQGLYWWDPDTRRYVFADTLIPARGYWVLANDGCIITVSNQALLARTEGEPTSLGKSTESLLWLLGIVITSDDGSSDPLIREFGMATDASDCFDENLDIILPPQSPGEVGLDAYFQGNDPIFSHFARDIRKLSESESWVLKVQSKSRVKLEWGLSSIPSDMNLELDMKNRVIDMRKESCVDISSGGDYTFVITATASLTGIDIEEEESTQAAPLTFELFQSYPNPFNLETIIRYQMPEPNRVNLKIYNVSGQLVRTLVNHWKEAGHHEVIWDSKDNSGNDVSSGVYFYKIQVGDFQKVRKIVLLK